MKRFALWVEFQIKQGTREAFLARARTDASASPASSSR